MYPAIEPYDTGFLDVGDGHRLYYEQSGNAEGFPAIFLHGGPGGGSHPLMRQFFNPDFYRIILFDQRGCGKSTPFASLENNNIEALVRDVESLRIHLGVDKWLVSGGSWGSTLALFYVLSYPETVLELILTGIFFADERSTKWLAEEGGASELMPEWFAPYRDFIPPEKRKEGLIAAYDDIMTDGTEAEQLEATKRFTLYDTAMLYLDPPWDRLKEIEEKPEESLPLVRTFFHFARHYYTDRNREAILDGVQSLSDIPCTIIHGRNDLICPVRNAFELHEAYPGSELFVLPQTAHTTRNPTMTAKVIEITDRIAQNGACLKKSSSMLYQLGFIKW